MCIRNSEAIKLLRLRKEAYCRRRTFEPLGPGTPGWPEGPNNPRLPVSPESP